jgi:hypothetical protein
MTGERRGGRAARLAAIHETGHGEGGKPYRRQHEARTVTDRVLFLCCGAVAKEILAIAKLHGWDHVDVRGLPARLHNEPQLIVPTLQRWIEKARPRYGDRIFIGYGDCGTGGDIDKLCARENLARIPGPHCYSFLSGNADFMAALDDNTTTYYLTDFLVSHFEALVVQDLWLDRRPELKKIMFGHYDKLVYLAQEDDAERDRRAAHFAKWLDLDYERKLVGRGDLASFVERVASEALEAPESAASAPQLRRATAR